MIICALFSPSSQIYKNRLEIVRSLAQLDCINLKPEDVTRVVMQVSGCSISDVDPLADKIANQISDNVCSVNFEYVNEMCDIVRIKLQLLLGRLIRKLVPEKDNIRILADEIAEKLYNANDNMSIEDLNNVVMRIVKGDVTWEPVIIERDVYVFCRERIGDIKQFNYSMITKIESIARQIV